MKKDVLKQLQSYSACIAGLIAADAAHGQIVYTDVDPDQDVNGNFEATDWKDESAWATHQFDLDDDGNADYTLRIRSDMAHGAGFLDPTDGNFYVNNPNENPFASPLDMGTQIGEDENQVWQGLLVYPNGYNYLGTLTTFGKTLDEGGGGWTGKTDKYLGLKFKIGSNFHYGWARMDVRDDSRVYTLKDFAYESTPEKAIMAGDGKPAGFENSASELMNIYSHRNNLKVLLNNEAHLNTTMSVYDIAGKKIFTRQLQSKNNEFSLDVPTGIYLVKIDLKEGVFTKKIILE